MSTVASPGPEELPAYGHHIGGTSVEPSSGDYLFTEDPFTGLAWARIARGTRDDVAAAVAAAGHAFREGTWPAMTPSERGRMLWKLGDAVVAHVERLAEIARGRARRW